LLIPLSYATVLGGTVTLIGTSTNLVVAGLQEERYKDMGEEGKQYIFGFFDLAPYGIPYAIWGMAYIVLFSR
jgi:di/tricarboxylate transporter